MKFSGSSVLRCSICLPRKPVSWVQSRSWRSTAASCEPSEQPLTLFPYSHEGPVWQVAWAHPMYGNILASCSYDRKVIIWKEENGTWEKTHEHTGHDSSGTAGVVGAGGRGIAAWLRSPCPSPWVWLAFLLSIHSRGKALRPKASLKRNNKRKKHSEVF